MKKRSWFGLIVLALVIIGVVLATGRQAPPLAAGSFSAGLSVAGPYEIAVTDTTFIDSTRVTNANGDFEGAPDRRLEASIWHPVDMRGGSHPLVVFSHGFMSMRRGVTYLGEHLASLGYLVIAADYPLTNFNAPGGPEVKDVVNQPGDISHMIDTILEWSADPDSDFYGAVDPARIGVMGISLGGMTSTMVSYDPHRRDPRIAAAISIAGPINVFGRPYFENSDIPFMMLATDQDAMVKYSDNALPVLDRIDNSILVTVAGASHAGFSDPTSSLRWFDNPDSIGCYMIRRTIDLDAERQEPWYELLGTSEEGILVVDESHMCEQDPLPPAMNPLHQQQLALLAVSSFFQSVFAADIAERQRHASYLLKTMATELPEITVAVGKDLRIPRA